MNNKENVLHIDGSAFAFLHGNKENYPETIREHLAFLSTVCETKKYIIYLEKSITNFRLKYGVTNIYKGHRAAKKDQQKEYLPYLEEVFAHINERYKPVYYLGIENDDAISISVRHQLLEGVYRPIVCGDDSDLLSINALHYRLKKNAFIDATSQSTIAIDAKGNLFATGIYATYSKILKGAAKENYKGLAGYGVKKVYNLLKDLTTEAEMRKLCFDEFVNQLGYKEGVRYLQEGFRLCYLLRSNNNFIQPQIQELDIDTDDCRLTINLR